MSKKLGRGGGGKSTVKKSPFYPHPVIIESVFVGSDQMSPNE